LQNFLNTPTRTCNVYHRMQSLRLLIKFLQNKLLARHSIWRRLPRLLA